MGAVKKVPLRKCVGCQEMKPKKELLRVIRTEEGTVMTDPTGKMNGRGAYLCRSAECLQKARKSGALERSLKMKAAREMYEVLEKEVGGLEE